jgi:hypothetical protein
MGSLSRRLSLVALVAAVLAAVLPTAQASDTDTTLSAMEVYEGPHLGANNFPPGCTRDASRDNPENVCFHQKDLSSLNPLGTAQIEVLLLVPASPTAERDIRIMRQAVAMWDGGIHFLGPRMGMPWLNNVRFHVTLDVVNDATGALASPPPVVAPDIVVVGLNPSAGTGAGLDALQLVGAGGVPCPAIAAPFDLAYWHSLPGFDSEHDYRAGSYSTSCGDDGHHVCFVVNGAQDPDPTSVDWFGSFWLTSHEFGHCLTMGHVGDGAEGSVNGVWWGPVPYQEIMNYEDHGDIRSSIGGAPAFDRCASTLDVETFALRMSHFLDVDGDGHVGPSDVRVANDQFGVDHFPMQVQHPSDYFYASSTGAAKDCPQPDLGLVPGDPSFQTAEHWMPKPADSVEARLDITGPESGQTTHDSNVVVSGSVAETSLLAPPMPHTATATVQDDPADATTPFTEIASVTATATDTDVDAVIHVGQVYPAAQGSQFSYSLVVNGMRFDSFVLDPKATAPQPLLTDGWEYVGSTEWDVAGSRILIHVPRSILRRFAIAPPYQISAIANYAGTAATAVHDDWAPQAGKTFSIAAPPERLTTVPENPSSDDDRDGVPDVADRCPTEPGLTADGCTAITPTQVRVSIGGHVVGSQDVYAHHGPDTFAIPVDLDHGMQTLRVEWVKDGQVLARRDLTITRRTGRGSGPGG